jgi:hypothetical protein
MANKARQQVFLDQRKFRLRDAFEVVTVQVVVRDVVEFAH